MARGRPPKPTKAKELAGTNRRDRENPNEPEPEGYLGDPPKRLGRHGKLMWEDLAPRLDTIGVTGSDDRWAFERLCASWDLCCRMEDAIRKKGEVTEDGRKRPELNILKDAAAEFFRLCGQFGLSPASRPKVSATSGKTVGDPRKPQLKIG